jgi:hypothetical protein
MEISDKRRLLRSHLAGKVKSISRSGRPLRLALAAVLLLLAGARCIDAAGADVPVGRAELGPCTADFTVKDSSNKPIYDARINVIIRYGFLSLRKLEIEVGTNNDGKARFEGLPAKSKRPIEFTIRLSSSSNQTKTVSFDPAAQCHANFDVVLGVTAAPTRPR